VTITLYGLTSDTGGFQHQTTRRQFHFSLVYP
jgi:hypothetical protein